MCLVAFCSILCIGFRYSRSIWCKRHLYASACLTVAFDPTKHLSGKSSWNNKLQAYELHLHLMLCTPCPISSRVCWDVVVEFWHFIIKYFFTAVFGIISTWCLRNNSPLVLWLFQIHGSSTYYNFKFSLCFDYVTPHEHSTMKPEVYFYAICVFDLHTRVRLLHS